MPNDVFVQGREYAIGPAEQVPLGEGRTFDVLGLKIAVFRTRADEIFASQAQCPHRNGPLADGMLGGRLIMCPLHDRSYDLVTGKEIGGECDLTIYPIRRATDGTMMLTVPIA